MGSKVVAMEAKLLAVFAADLNLNVTDVCAQLGISRQTFYKYRRRWSAEGPPGLVERSRRPHRSPGQVSAEIEEAIVRIRKDVPIDNGALAISYHLARRDDLGPLPSVSTIHRVLVRRGMVTPQPEKRPRSSWIRFEWPRPNDAWQIDATCWALASGREVWIMDVLDDHSRVLVAARAVDGPTKRAAWDALSHGAGEWGLPAHVMSDNGSCFTGSNATADHEGSFGRHLRELGIQHIRSSPYHPQTCGKLERSHQTTKRWLSADGPVETLAELQHQLDRWRDHYNDHRPHSVARGRTPAERWQDQPPASPGDAIDEAPHASLLKVDRSGAVAWPPRHSIGVGMDLAGQTVLVVAHGDHLTVHANTGLVRELDLDRTRRYQPTGNRVGRPKHSTT